MPGNFIEVNEKFQNMLGYSRKELLRLSPQDVHAKEDQALIKDIAADVIKTKSIDFEEMLETKDGIKIPVEVSSHIFNFEGKKTAFSMIKDIREKKEREELLNIVFDTANIGICLIDSRGKVLEVNRRFCEIFDYTKEYIVGKHFNILRCDCGDDKFNCVFNVQNRENISNVDFEAIKNSNQKINLLGFSSVIKKDGDRYFKVVCIEDITYKKSLESRQKAQEKMLIQQSKMAEMGNMISAIAHQWKQPINAIHLMAEGIVDMYEFDEFDEKSVQELRDNIVNQTTFMANTIDDFRNFFKPSKNMVSFDVEDAILSIVRILTSQFKRHDIAVDIKSECKCYSVGYPNEFKHVILNILNNAKDIFVEKNINDSKILITIKETEDYILVEIRDNGGGIPKELLPDRIFEPYVSTKGEKGTGIGLSMSKVMIEDNMKGSIEASNWEEGAKFKIKINKAAQGHE